MKTIRVLLVDDHAFVRSGIRAVLDSEPGISVIGEASSGEEAIIQSMALHPDLIVMDINMPGIDGLEATRRIKSQQPGISVVMLTVNDAELFLVEAIRAGAGSYVLKDSPSEDLVRSIRATANGASLIPLHLLQRTVEAEHQAQSQELASEASEMIEALNEREMEVLVRIVKGMRNQEIAEELNVATVTVKKRVQSILGKMYVSDRTQAAVKAVKLKLVEV